MAIERRGEANWLSKYELLTWPYEVSPRIRAVITAA